MVFALRREHHLPRARDDFLVFEGTLGTLGLLELELLQRSSVLAATGETTLWAVLPPALAGYASAPVVFFVHMCPPSCLAQARVLVRGVATY